jgi:acetylornithine deacetylase/succinyl-diaminopimelate desuccinylase-like protein
MFGGAAFNPIHVLADTLAALHDPDGRIALPGFYDGVSPPPAEITAQWETLGFDGDRFLRDVGLVAPAGEKDRSVLEKIWARPTCEVNGIIGGYAGEGFKTVIPSTAKAKVSFRLVGRQDPAAVADGFRKFVRERVPAGCRVDFISHAGNPASVLPIDGKEFLRARRALGEEWGRDPAILGSGGSIPVVGDFKGILGLDSLMIGFGLDDDRIHSPNEKYELTSFHRGIRSWARILMALSE